MRATGRVTRLGGGIFDYWEDWATVYFGQFFENDGSSHIFALLIFTGEKVVHYF
jgi:hypothetical protein